MRLVALFLLLESLPVFSADSADIPGGNGFLPYLRPVLLGTLLVSALALLLAAPVAQAADIAVARGAYTLRANLQGDVATTVVFESGFGQGAGAWSPVIAALGAECRCITYSRAGIGPSGTKLTGSGSILRN